tara:strand:+ start:1137 stop:2675 length:1539 start_codon:yes stop_codon:yes gene_type:complete
MKTMEISMISCQFSISEIYYGSLPCRKPLNQLHFFQGLLFVFLLVCFTTPGHASIRDGDVRDILEGLIDAAPEKFRASLARDVEMEQVIYLDIAVLEEALLAGSYVELPLFHSYYLVRFNRTNPGTPGVITYMGDVLDEDEHHNGSILLTYGSGLFYGLIATGDGIYQILPMKDDPATSYLLQKMKSIPTMGITDFDDPSGSWVEPDHTVAGIPQQSLLEGGGAVPLSSNFTVDVLVLYTPSVRAGKGGTTPTNNWVNTIISDYNAKLTELGTTSFTLSLKASLETTWPTFPTVYHENMTHNGPNACISGNCDSLVADQYWVSTNSTVASLRNTYAADLVVLITADSQKHPNDMVHGFAGWKGSTHGANTSGFRWGEFVTVRDAFALANLTFHHEVGHAFAVEHVHGARTFGYLYAGGAWTLPPGPSGARTPLEIMQVNPSVNDPICLWSTNSPSSSCHMRFPFFAHASKTRNVFYSGFFVPRIFDPRYTPQYIGVLKGQLEQGAAHVSTLR